MKSRGIGDLDRRNNSRVYRNLLTGGRWAQVTGGGDWEGSTLGLHRPTPMANGGASSGSNKTEPNGKLPTSLTIDIAFEFNGKPSNFHSMANVQFSVPKNQNVP